MALLLVHLVATAALAGLVWVVQLVVYPSFLLVGASPAWPAVHAAHTRAVVLAVGPPWAVQGVTVAALLVRDMIQADGSVVFQRGRRVTNRVTFVRWTAAPTFRALARLARAQKRAAA